jgi:diaminohydroxyphosphoribosylaminopyrimidine deaminase/5-amino-6-(5-phosphoribosylamino)uracil reductase
LVEGGGKLLAQVHEAGLVDHFYAVVAPRLIGGETAHSPLAGLGIGKMVEAIDLADPFHAPLGNDLLVGGFVLDGTSSP